MSLKDFIIGGGLLLIFMFSMIMFTIQVSYDNRPDNPVLMTSLFNNTFAKVNTSLRTYQDIAEDQRNATTKENPILGSDSLIITSIWTAGKVFGNLMMNGYNIIFEPLEQIGVSPVITGAIIAFIIIAVIFLTWRMYKAGE